MGIGSSIALIAIGAILAFAVTFSIAGVEIQTIGWILMITGIAALALTLTLRRRRLAGGIHTHLPPTGDTVTHEHDV